VGNNKKDDSRDTLFTYKWPNNEKFGQAQNGQHALTESQAIPFLIFESLEEFMR